MPRLHSWNAYESALVGSIDDTTTTIIVESAAALTFPLYLCIDPDDPSIREFVKVTGISVNTLTVERAAAGSANALGSPHEGGARIRAIAVHQWLTEIFDDVELNTSNLDDHETTDPDPHPQYLTEAEGSAAYVNKTGDSMSGPLTLAANPATDPEAARKEYVDTQDVATQDAAKDYSDGLDHDHATPIGLHADIDGAHHDKYTDGEAVAAMGDVGDANDLNHNRYTDAEAQDAVGGGGATINHDDLTGVSTSDHHAKYTDAEAVDANLNQHVVVSSHHDTTLPNLTSATFVEITSKTVGIPNDWNSYQVVARSMVQYANAGATTQLQARVQINGNDGLNAQDGVVDVGDDADSSPVHLRTAETADPLIVKVFASTAQNNNAGTGKYANLDIVVARVS